MKHILLIDDEVHFRNKVQKLLEMEKYIVSIASDGLEALQVMETVKPDLILTDILMPRMDGLQLLEKIKKNHTYKLIPIIFLTGLDLHQTYRKVMFLGADDFLTKPFKINDLLNSIKIRFEKNKNK